VTDYKVLGNEVLKCKAIEWLSPQKTGLLGSGSCSNLHARGEIEVGDIHCKIVCKKATSEAPNEVWSWLKSRSPLRTSLMLSNDGLNSSCLMSLRVTI